MSDPSRVFFTGNSLDQAILAAARHYGVEPQDLAYERVERRYGFLRARRRVVIRVDPERPTVDRKTAPLGDAGPAAPSPAAGSDVVGPPRSEETERAGGPRAGRGDRPAAGRGDRPEAPAPLSEEEVAGEAGPDLPLAEGESAQAASAAAKKLVSLAGLDLDVEVYQGEDQLQVELQGLDESRLVAGEGRLLMAIQHLLPRLMHSALGEVVPCRVDSRGFRDRRRQSLQQLAIRTAEEVRRRGRPKTLRAMNPADRRTVHLALQDAEDVVTESAGDGFYKRVTIRLA